MISLILVCHTHFIFSTEQRKDEDYDEDVEENLQDEVRQPLNISRSSHCIPLTLTPTHTLYQETLQGVSYP